jgi:hypothetical protein
VVNEKNQVCLYQANIQIKNPKKVPPQILMVNFLKGLPSVRHLFLSYIGFKILNIRSQKQSCSYCSLSWRRKSLDEVVVIGYGSQKRREVTGAVSVVDSKTLEILKPVKIEQALQGTVSGVNVTSTSGSPGAALDIRIEV